MLKKIVDNSWIVAIVPGLILALIGWRFFQDRPYLVFSLTSPVNYPISLGSPSNPKKTSLIPVGVQQLEIINRGNAKAEKITIKFHKAIQQPVISKFSMADKPESSLAGLPMEIVYPSLPPGKAFKVTFRTDPKKLDPAITASNLEISHDGGDAIDASNAKPSPYNSLTFNFLILVYVGLIVSQIVVSHNRRELNTLQNKPIREILSKEKPYYSKIRDWEDTVEEAIRKKLQYHRSSNNLSADWLQHPSYIVLDSERPLSISKRQWERILETAKSLLFRDMGYAITIDSSEKERLFSFQEIKKIPKPKNIGEEDWQEKQEKCLKEAVDFSPQAMRAIRDPKGLLMEGSPENLDASAWQRLKKSASSYLSRDIISNSYNKDFPIEIISDEEFELLEESDKKDVHEKLYSRSLAKLPEAIFPEKLSDLIARGKPHWMKDEDWGHYERSWNRYKELKSMEERKLTSLQEKSEYLDGLTETFRVSQDTLERLLVTGHLPGVRPEAISESQWLKMKLHERTLRLATELINSGSSTG